MLPVTSICACALELSYRDASVQNQIVSTGLIPSLSPIPTHINSFDSNRCLGTGFGWALAYGWGRGSKDQVCVSSHLRCGWCWSPSWVLQLCTPWLGTRAWETPQPSSFLEGPVILWGKVVSGMEMDEPLEIQKIRVREYQGVSLD